MAHFKVMFWNFLGRIERKHKTRTLVVTQPRDILNCEITIPTAFLWCVIRCSANIYSFLWFCYNRIYARLVYYWRKRQRKKIKLLMSSSLS